LKYDATKPDGTPRKLLDAGRLRDLGWRAGVDLKSGIASAYRDFLAREGAFRK
jgi:GDP-L-fucose synthase